MIHASRAFGALAGAAALIIAGMSPASAAIWRHNDAVGDVLSQTESFDEGSGNYEWPEPTVLPENTDTDVSQIRVAHRTHRVVLKTTLRDLSATSGYVAYNILTGARNYFVMQRLGKDRMYPAFDISRMNGKPVRCAAVERSVDRVNDRATASIPARCLGRAEWVRVGAGAVKLDLSDETAFTFLVDDAIQEATALDELAMSPRVHRN